MSLTNLPNKTLLEKTDFLAREERRITVELIEHLREIERRMLYAELGYGSLHDFCVKRLGLSEGSAQRRIQAMRLARELPEVKTAILDGSISLTNAAKLQTAFQAQKKIARDVGQPILDTEGKRELLKEVSGLTQKECETKLCEILPEASREMNRERVRRIGRDSHELRLVVTDAFLEKLTRVRELLSHSVPSGSALEIFERLLNAEVARFEKRKGLDRCVEPQSDASTVDRSTVDTSAHSRDEPTPIGTAPVPNETNRSVFSTPSATRKAIPAHIRRSIWIRARGRCEILGCESRFRLEIDHIHPIALGGKDEAGNLRLLCRTHNLAEAALRVGAEKMQPYVSALRAG
jgi:hypothetical protein